RAKHGGSNQIWFPKPNDVILLDHLPELADYPLLESYAEWFAGVFAWLSRAAAAPRIGMREIQPGIWAALRTRIAPSARLQPPCWLGQNVWIGPEAVIGPMTVLEERVVVESGATIARSVVGRETFVGRLTNLDGSLAW